MGMQPENESKKTGKTEKKYVSRKLRPKVIKIAVVVIIAAFTIANALFVNLLPIDLRVIVTVMGVDKTEQGIRVTVNALAPVSSGNNELKQEMIEAEGETFERAVKKLSAVSGSKVEITQCGMIVFGKSISDEGILPEVKAIFSEGIISAGAILLASDKIEARDFISKLNGMSEESSKGLNSFVSYYEKSLNMPLLTLMDFLSQSITESRTSYIPCMELNEINSSDTVPGQQKEAGSKKTVIQNIGTALLFRDGVKVKHLNESETRGIIWMEPHSKNGFVYLDSFKVGETEYGEVCGEVKTTKSGIDVYFKDGKPHARFKLTANIIVDAKYRFSLDLDKDIVTEPELQAVLSDSFSDTIQADISSTIQAMRQYDSDIFKLKYLFYRLHNKEITEYEKKATNDFNNDIIIEYDIKVKAK